VHSENFVITLVYLSQEINCVALDKIGSGMVYFWGIIFANICCSAKERSESESFWSGIVEVTKNNLPVRFDNLRAILCADCESPL